MAYLKFLDANKLIPCVVIPQGNIVTLKFPDKIIVDTSGFLLYLDEQGQYDIGGEEYIGFRTVYRNDDETAKFNGYQLSNDGSVWVEPVPQPDPPIPTPTEEELAEQKRQEDMAERMNQISALKQLIEESDYKIIKAYEYSLVGKECEYDIQALHDERQNLRNEINSLETELYNLQEDENERN